MTEIIVLIIVILIIYFGYKRYLYLKANPRELPPPSDLPTFTTNQGWDFPENDIMVDGKLVTHGLDELGCIKFCAKTPSCVGTSYNTVDSACWLKSKLENGRKLDNALTQVLGDYNIPKGTNDEFYKNILSI